MSNYAYISKYITATNRSKTKRLFQLLEENNQTSTRKDCASFDVGNYDYVSHEPQSPNAYESHISQDDSVRCITKQTLGKIVDLFVENDPNAGERTTHLIEQSSNAFGSTFVNSTFPLGSEAYVHEVINSCADRSALNVGADVPGMNGPAETSDRMSKCIASKFYSILDQLEETAPTGDNMYVGFMIAALSFFFVFCAVCVGFAIKTHQGTTVFGNLDTKDKVKFVTLAVFASIFGLVTGVLAYLVIEYYSIQGGQMETGAASTTARTFLSAATHHDPRKRAISGAAVRPYRFVSSIHSCRHHIAEGAWITYDGDNGVYVRVGERGENVYLRPDGTGLHEQKVINGVKYLCLTLSEVEKTPVDDKDRFQRNLAMILLTPKEYLRNSAFCNENKDETYGRLVYNVEGTCFADVMRMDPLKRAEMMWKALDTSNNNYMHKLEVAMMPKNMCVLFEDSDPVNGKIIIDYDIISGSACPSSVVIDDVKYRGNFISEITNDWHYCRMGEKRIWWMDGGRSDLEAECETLGGEMQTTSVLSGSFTNTTFLDNWYTEMVKGNDQFTIKGWMERLSKTYTELYGTVVPGDKFDSITSYNNLPAFTKNASDTFRGIGTIVPNLPRDYVKMEPLSILKRKPIEE
mmetsp:Transcript_43055/g.111512  ORF Transcript_43055/g.111512 Transcript_43055/m.111512 type:complete len:634 (-) Transcript_43055:4034-5935(-)